RTTVVSRLPFSPAPPAWAVSHISKTNPAASKAILTTCLHLLSSSSELEYGQPIPQPELADESGVEIACLCDQRVCRDADLAQVDQVAQTVLRDQRVCRRADLDDLRNVFGAVLNDGCVDRARANLDY